jgi:hypothetical protein
MFAAIIGVYTQVERGGWVMAREADEAAKFWTDFEQETGEKVEARSIGEYYQDRGDSNGLWGLLVLTDKAFRFKHMPSDNWLSSIFKRATSSQKPEPIDLRIAREEVRALSMPKRNLPSRIFGSPFRRFTLQTEGEGYAFSLDPSSGLQDALQKAFPPTSLEG